MAEVTQILSQIEEGDPNATEQLMPLVYDELRKLAAAKMSQENPGQTLQATGLVHEAYVRLVDGQAAQNWNNRGHFFAAAAEAMRRILIENARRKAGPQAAGNLKRVEISCVAPEASEPDVDLLALRASASRTKNWPTKQESSKTRDTRARKKGLPESTE